MGITSALFSGTSGITANGAALAVIGNNIANVNTVGFKASRTSFEDILSQSLSSAATTSQIGRGVDVSSVSRIFNQGSFQTTDSETDLAIDGDGFFIVSSGSKQVFTRAGQFIFDDTNRLVTPEGMVLQGQLSDGLGNLTGAVRDLDFSNLLSTPANPTSEVRISANLNSDAASPAAFDPANPSATSNFSTSLTVFDSIGNSHTLTIYFRKTSTANQWEYYALADASEVTGGAANVVGASGALLFNTEGALVSETPNAGVDFDFLGATQSQAVSFDFGESTTDGGTGLTGTTQFSAVSATVFQSQDGFASGDLQNFSISPNGVVTGNFSNGEALTLAQISLARFTNSQGLRGMGKNLFEETGPSGPPIIGIPQTGGRGSVSSNSLELSNVDLASEFVNLITTQRGFQASSRIITSTDQLLEELVNLVR